MKKTIIILLALMPLISMAQTPLWQGKGRIIIGADGNEHDNDDWAATPLSLALLASQGLQDKLTLYVYSNHIWSSSQENKFINGLSPYEQMNQSALGGQKWFGFNKTNFICAVDNPEVAYNSVRDEINKSSEKNPLFIIEGGPMQIVGEAFSRADRNKLEFVTLISHSPWNDNHANESYGGWDNHSGWTWNQIKEQFSASETGGLNMIHIANQNGKDEYPIIYPGIKTDYRKFDWLKTSAFKDKTPYYQTGSWDWLYSRLHTFIECRGGNIFDASDAGMVVFLLTGIEYTSPDIVRRLMERENL